MKNLNLLILPIIWISLILFRPASKLFLEVLELDFGWRGIVGILATIATMAAVIALLVKYPVIGITYLLIGLALGLTEGWIKGSYKLLRDK